MPSGSRCPTSLLPAACPEPRRRACPELCRRATEGFLRPLADGAVAVLLAPLCAACRVPLDRPTRGAVCPGCWAAIIPITPPCCRTCGDPLPTWRVQSVAEAMCPRCRRREPLVSLARAVGPYEGALRAIVPALKYDRRPTPPPLLPARMRQARAHGPVRPPTVRAG